MPKGASPISIPNGSSARTGTLDHVLAHEQSLADSLQHLTNLAVQALPGVDGVGLTLVEGVGPDRSAAEGQVSAVAGATDQPVNVRTATHSDQWVVDVDIDQYRAGTGPCLQAIVDGQMHVVPMSSEDPQFPEFSRLATERGVASNAAMPLRSGDQVAGAMNLYSRSADAFGDQNLALAQAIAIHVGSVLANLEAYRQAADLAKNLQAALDSRAVIEQAKGMVMLQRRCSADEAFQTLVAASQVRNKKLRDIAVEVVEGAPLEGQ